MKRTALYLIIATCFFFVFSITLAQEATPLTPTPSPMPIEYTLPYPGILPDHPLYFLKALRDSILEKLISNPVRKVEFYILTADKRLNMSVFLMNANKQELAAKTATQAVDYIERAEKQLFEIPAGSNAEVNNLKDRLEKSLLKHQEELASFVEQTSPPEQEIFKMRHAQVAQILEGFYGKK